MPLNRRELLKTLSIAAALPSCKNLFSLEKNMFVVSAYKDRHYLDFFWGEELVLSLKSPSHSHSIEFSPSGTHLLGIDKLGSQSFVLDLKSLRFSPLKTEGYFYGHGTFITENMFLLSQGPRVSMSQSILDYPAGEIGLYRLENGKVKKIKMMNSSGSDPHDIHFKNQKVFVCNGGNDSNLSIFDKNLNLIKSFRLNDKTQSIRHLSFIDQSTAVLFTKTLSKSKKANIYKVNLKNGGISAFTTRKSFKDITENQVFPLGQIDKFLYASSPSGSVVLKYNIDNKTLDDFYPHHRAVFGGTKNDKILIGSKDKAGFLILDKNLRVLKKLTSPVHTRASGEHSSLVPKSAISLVLKNQKKEA